MSSPIPGLRDYCEYLKALDRPLDIEGLLFGEGLPSRDSRAVPNAVFDDSARDLDVLEPDGFEEIVELDPAADGRVGRRLWLIAAAAAVALLLIVGSVLVRRTGDDDTKTERPAGPGTSTTTVTRAAPSTAVEVARGFLEAYGAFDTDRALTYLTEDALATGSGHASSWGSPESFRMEAAFLEAHGVKQILTGCEEQDGSARGVVVRCAFDVHAIHSDELGRGPYTDNYWDFVVRDGQITSAVSTWAFLTSGLSEEMWEPFADWVATTHPQDVEVMYTDATQRLQRITEPSIRLWDRHTQEYAAAGIQYVARVRAICEAARQRVLDEGAPAPAYYDASWGRILDDALAELRALSSPPETVADQYNQADTLVEQFADEMRSGDVSADTIHELEQIPGMQDCTFYGPR